MASSMLDFFTDWMVRGVAVYAPTKAYNSSTGAYSETFAATGKTLDGIKYGRSAAERYFSERFQPDVTEVLVAEYDSSIATTNRLVYDSKTYAVDSVVNVADQNEIMLVGLKEFT